MLTRRLERFTGLLVAGFLLVLAGGCFKAPEISPMMKHAENVEVSAEALQVRVRDLADKLPRLVEIMADRIIRESDDPDARREALVWKMEIIPSLYQALFQSDPLVALLDVWAFTVQIERFVAEHAGSLKFWEFEPLIAETAVRLRNEVEEIAQWASPDITEVRAQVEEWAREHPLDPMTSGRDSLGGSLPEILAARRAGGFAGIGGLTVDLGDVTARLVVYADFLPKMAKWQAELLIAETIGDRRIGEALDDFTELKDAANTLQAFLDETPDLIDTQLGTALEGVTAERIAVLEEVERHLRTTLKHVTHERVAIIDEVRQERVAVLDAIQQERIATLAALQLERVVVLKEIDRLVGEVLDQSSHRAEGAIDHLFKRLAFLLAIAFVLGVITAVVFTRWVLGRMPHTGSS